MISSIYMQIDKEASIRIKQLWHGSQAWSMPADPVRGVRWESVGGTPQSHCGPGFIILKTHITVGYLDKAKHTYFPLPDNIPELTAGPPLWRIPDRVLNWSLWICILSIWLAEHFQQRGKLKLLTPNHRRFNAYVKQKPFLIFLLM